MAHTLLLNATYEPLRVISISRAIVLVLAEKAEVVLEGEERYHSASSSIPVPSVIRLVRFVRIPYRARLPLNRRAVLARDHGLCQYCGKSGDTMDHVLPRSRGGEHRWENVVTACRPCNAKKDDKLLSELGWVLEHQPRVPKGIRWLVIGITVDEAWLPYLELAV